MKKTGKSYKPKPIPPFKTLEEEAKFWNTHDTSGLGKIHLLKLPVIEKEKDQVFTLRLQRSVKESLDKIAQRIGINTSTLARMWLIERLNQINDGSSDRIRLRSV